jgi:hypothetical protein
MLCRHLRDHRTAPDGRLFRGARGGVLSESVYGRAWHAAREATLGPELAATALARPSYDLRHAALSLWLNVSGAPAEVAARARTSARVLHDVYLHCTDDQDDLVSQRIEDALDEGGRPPSQCVKASGYVHRRHRPGPCPLYVREPAPVSRIAHGCPVPQTRHAARRRPPLLLFTQVRPYLKPSPPKPGDGRIRPTHSPRTTADGLMNRSLSRQKPVTQSSITGFKLRIYVAGVGFEPT